MVIGLRNHSFRLTWVFLGLVFGAVISASAQPTVAVVIMPFVIHAQPEMVYLKDEIPEAMRQQFVEDGANARVLDAETAAAWGKAGETEADLGRMAIQIGADYVVSGSLTWI